MKKILLILIILLASSCSTQINPRKVAYPFSLYLFKNDSFFKTITNTDDPYGVAILSSTPYKSATVELESGLDVKLFIATNTGENYAEALTNIHIEGCNMVNLHFVKSLIIHNNLLNEDELSKALSFVYFNNVIRPNIYLYTTKKDFKEIYNVTSSNGKTPYFNMINSSIFPQDFERMKQITINDFLTSYYDNNRSTYIIDLDITYNNEFIKEEDELLANPQYEIKGLFYTTLDRKKKLFSYLERSKLDGLSYYNKCTSYNLQTDDNNYQVFIDKVTFKRDIDDNNIHFLIDASLHSSLFNIDTSYIKTNIENKILNDLTTTYNYALLENVDIYHMYDYSTRLNKKIETHTSFSVNLNLIFQNNAKL